LTAENGALLRYCETIRMADARSMWDLGCDAALRGADDAFGSAYARLQHAGIATLYLWGRHNAPAATAAHIDRASLRTHEFGSSGHWKSSEAPAETAGIALRHFAGARLLG
jgi:pimeloyl-ACP methyl ester carboxylesterase